MGSRPNSLSLVVADANRSTPPRFAISARKPHRRLLCYLGSEPLGLLVHRKEVSYFFSPDLLTRRLSRASLPGPVAANKRKMKQNKTALSPEFITGQKPRGKWEVK